MNKKSNNATVSERGAILDANHNTRVPIHIHLPWQSRWVNNVKMDRLRDFSGCNEDGSCKRRQSSTMRQFWSFWDILKSRNDCQGPGLKMCECWMLSADERPNCQLSTQYCWVFHDQLWEALSGTISGKRGVPGRTGGERILEMLWEPQMPWIIGLWASQPYSRGEFQETLWERFRGLSGIHPEFFPESPSRTGGMAQSLFSNLKRSDHHNTFSCHVMIRLQLTYLIGSRFAIPSFQHLSLVHFWVRPSHFWHCAWFKAIWMSPWLCITSGAKKDPQSQRFARTAPKNFLDNSRGLLVTIHSNTGFEANRTRKFTRKFGEIFVAKVLWGTFSVPNYTYCCRLNFQRLSKYWSTCCTHSHSLPHVRDNSYGQTCIRFLRACPILLPCICVTGKAWRGEGKTKRSWERKCKR